MLLELRLRNVAVIEAVTLPLSDGLNVLTGETGAGKSLIVGALGLLLGERAAADRIRSGAERATVEASFDARALPALAGWIDEHGIDAGEDDCVILKREVALTGRSRAWINGTPVTVGTLRALGEQLVTVHGQHEAQALLGAGAQRELLDAFAQATQESAAVAAAFAAWQQARQALATFEQSSREVAQRADFLRFQLQEIDAAKVRPGEDETVEMEHRRLAHASELRGGASSAAALLDGGDASVVAQLAAARRLLLGLQKVDESLDRLTAPLDATLIAAEELARELEAYADDIDADPERLAALDARRGVLHALMRKYGPTLEDVLAVAESARQELAMVDDASAVRTSLEEAELRARRAVDAACSELTARRVHGATALSQRVAALLPELGMVDGRFEVVLVPLESATAAGREQVHFHVALNAGSAPGPLERMASGGELARVMLALSTVLAELQQVPTLVFDEVDAGVGGAVAWQVGALMQRVATHHQVLAISHLAQIAACAHHHVTVRKGSGGAVTTSDTHVLTGDDRVTELARMLGGDSDREVSRAHARELLERGRSATASLADAVAGRASEKASRDAAATTTTARQRRGKRG